MTSSHAALFNAVKLTFPISPRQDETQNDADQHRDIDDKAFCKFRDEQNYDQHKCRDEQIDRVAIAGKRWVPPPLPPS